jgi:hypothetical protein
MESRRNEKKTSILYSGRFFLIFAKNKNIYNNMNQNLDRQLSEKYPKLFKNKNLPPSQTLMCFGCECGDGWYKVLDHLFCYLTELMERKLHIDYSKEYQEKYKGEKDFYKKYSSYKFLPPQIVLDQVKEKYATLRVYYHIVSEDIPEDIWAALDLDDFYKKLKEYQDAVDHAIEFAEYQSSRTCEVTGEEGKLYIKGWHKVLCDDEAKKIGYLPEEDSAKLIIKNA